MKLIHSILRVRSTTWQSKGATVGLILGLSLVLLTAHFYVDLLQLGRYDTADILIINKQFDRYYGAERSFSETEIDVIKDQSFFYDIAVFQSNRYEVMLQSDRLGFRTLIFFQEVPNRFLGMDTSDFDWKEGEKVPIVLSKDYLALYNYGFAPSQGLPNIPASAIGLMDFDIKISGRGSSRSFKGYIHGFTSTINSILVPSSFMSYCNERFGVGVPSGIKQVIARTDQPGSPAMASFFKDKGYELSRSSLIGSEWVVAIKMVLGFVFVLGVSMMFLSILVFILFVGKHLSEHLSEVQILLDLGYEPKVISTSLLRNIRSALLIGGSLGVTLYLTCRVLINQLATAYGVETAQGPLILFCCLGGIGIIGLYILLQKRIQKQIT